MFDFSSLTVPVSAAHMQIPESFSDRPISYMVFFFTSPGKITVPSKV